MRKRDDHIRKDRSLRARRRRWRFVHSPLAPHADRGNSFRIRSSLICHPGPTVGYRIESEDGIVAYLCDHEPALGLPNGRWPSSDWISGYDIAMDADLLIHDAQYTDEEYARCIGWGHSTYRHEFEFAARVGAKRIVPFHHDPSHDDETLDRLLDHALAASKCPCAVSPGCEGTTFELGS
jgi:phosphoribosyl 1,2-cyclic phosphodiesterase